MTSHPHERPEHRPERADGRQRPERRRGRIRFHTLSMRRRGTVETCSDERVHSDGAGDRARAASGDGSGPRSNGAGRRAADGPGGDEQRWRRPAWLGAAALAVVVVLVALVALIAVAAGAFSVDEGGTAASRPTRSAST